MAAPKLQLNPYFLSFRQRLMNELYRDSNLKVCQLAVTSIQRLIK